MSCLQTPKVRATVRPVQMDQDAEGDNFGDATTRITEGLALIEKREIGLRRAGFIT